MARETDKNLRGKIIYSVFTRNYSMEGTFEAVRKDLDRIRDLGTDIVWLMPVHPSGREHRKGSLGSPYAIRDYRAVDPAQGSREEFCRLVSDIHARGMKCIIDVVFHHTSPDSWLAEHHPEWFYHRKDGSFGNQVGDWWDVIDLDYTQRDLWRYLTDTLVMWAEIVDGFRCDVAPMVPMAFWEEARREVARVRPDAVWLAETVEGNFILSNRSSGVYCASDAETYAAFDICYEYDIANDRDAFLEGKGTLAHYLEGLNREEELYPDNYDKLRFLENHDRRRIHELIPDEYQLRNWTAFLYMEKGTVLLYNGQEKGCRERPSLFDPDPILWEGRGENGMNPDLTPLLRRLAEIHHSVIPCDASFHAEALSDDVCLAWQRENGAPGQMEQEKTGRTVVAGLFALGRNAGEVRVPDDLPFDFQDGKYTNLITGEPFEVRNRSVSAAAMPLILVIPS